MSENEKKVMRILIKEIAKLKKEQQDIIDLMFKLLEEVRGKNYEWSRNWIAGSIHTTKWTNW